MLIQCCITLLFALIQACISAWSQYEEGMSYMNTQRAGMNGEMGFGQFVARSFRLSGKFYLDLAQLKLELKNYTVVIFQ